MRGLSILAACLLPLTSAVALPQSAPSSSGNSGSSGGGPSQDRANAVKDAFQFAWDGYWQYAFPHDELKPVTNGFSDTRNGWGATAVDALSTALLMKNQDVVTKILDFIPTIDFSKSNTPGTVSLFETTIRYLGGMLSGYDLLKGPLKELAGDRAFKVDALLNQSIALADRLSFAFDTPSGVPYNNLVFSNNSSPDWYNGIATIGTLVLEWTRLSDITGNQKYAELAQKGESYLLNPKPAYAEPFPGLIGTWVNISNGNFLDNHVSWSGGDDSFYEYLIKMFVYDAKRFETYRDRWVKAADSTIQYLASHPSSRPDLTFLAEANGQVLIFESEHLTCFDGGNFILGGLVLHNQAYIDFGLELVNGCRATYEYTVTGIGPEVFSWDNATIPANQTEFFEKAGFWIKDGDYVLRPEVIESFYYAYRATGDPKYQEWAWAGFKAVNATTRANSGYSSITNVNTPGGGRKTDQQESFLFAEVLKYSYLIFAEDDEWQVEHGGLNGWVFNTEAHPFKVFGPLTGSDAE